MKYSALFILIFLRVGGGNIGGLFILLQYTLKVKSHCSKQFLLWKVITESACCPKFRNIIVISAKRSNYARESTTIQEKCSRLNYVWSHSSFIQLSILFFRKSTWKKAIYKKSSEENKWIYIWLLLVMFADKIFSLSTIQMSALKESQNENKSFITLFGSFEVVNFFHFVYDLITSIGISIINTDVCILS